MQTDNIVLSDRELDEIFSTDCSLRIKLKPIEEENMPSSPASSVPSSPTGSVKDDMIPLPEGVVPQRCGYRTGKCQNLQAVKRNGKLHKLCEFHREKANQNQKKLDRKKRLMRYSPYEPHMSSDDESSITSFDNSPRSIDGHQFDVHAPHPTCLHEAPLGLGGEELAIFYNIMTFDINYRGYGRTQMYQPHHHAPYTSIV